MTLMRFLLASAICAAALTLSGCASGPAEQAPPLTDEQVAMVKGALERIEPAAKSVCEQSLPQQDCSLTVAVADASDRTVNAYQVRGRPLIVFTEPMLATFRNGDEVAFVYAHEAAHYILQHGEKRRAREVFGALLLGGLAATQYQGTVNQNAITQEWARIGSQVGNRIYSPEEELEADRLGADISVMAGFDPVIGVRIFDQTADRPQLQILPSHPRNHERIAAIHSRFR